MAEELLRWVRDNGSLEVNDTVAETSAGKLRFAKVLHLLAPHFEDFCGGSEEVALMVLTESIHQLLQMAEKAKASLLVMGIPEKGLPIKVVAAAFPKAFAEFGCPKGQSLRTIRILSRQTGKLDKLRDALAMEETTSFSSAASVGDEEVNCSVCMCELEDPTETVKELEKCGHRFHTSCIEETFQRMQKKCPICGTWYGVPKGNQPSGSMKVEKLPGSIPGYPADSGIIQIHYSLRGGTQGPEHPRPGLSFSGTSRTAYLPDTDEGRLVLDLLRLAWEYKLIFTVGDSHTSGAQNTTVWNCIHHKTSIHGGPQSYGYPDPTYLHRVEMEMAAQGVTRDLLQGNLHPGNTNKSAKKK